MLCDLVPARVLKPEDFEQQLYISVFCGPSFCGPVAEMSERTPVVRGQTEADVLVIRGGVPNKAGIFDRERGGEFVLLGTINSPCDVAGKGDTIHLSNIRGWPYWS